MNIQTTNPNDELDNNNENAASFFIDRHNQQLYSDKAAYIEADGEKRTLSYQSLIEKTNQMVGFYESIGIEQENRIAMIVQDTIEFPIIFWGSLKAGVIPIALNTLLSSDVYKTILCDCRAQVVFVSDALYEILAPIKDQCPNIKHLIKVGGVPSEGTEVKDFTTLLTSSEAKPAINVCSDEVAFWLYSSGSTGMPKGVKHAHGNLLSTIKNYAENILQIQQSDVCFSAAKMFFAYGLGNALSFPLSVGATTILYSERPTPDAMIDTLKAHNPSIFFGVPTLYASMLAYLENNPNTLSNRLRLCVSAGEALPDEVGRRWKKLTGVDILDGVGSTEMLHIFLSNHTDDVQYGTSGKAVPGYDLRLVDDEGQDVDVGEIGELMVRGDSAAEGYWNRRNKSRSTFEGTWTRTGDKYEQRQDGCFVYSGRTDDMFKVSGIWLSPFELEQALAAHEKVLEAAVVAAKDDEDLIKPKAFVVLKNPDQPITNLHDELKEFVKEKIGKWKYPRWVEFVDELPKTSTGKVQRFKLRDMDTSSADTTA